MNIEVRMGDWASMQTAARAVRDEVFIVEQQIPVELEWDEMDGLCMHAVAFDQAGQAIGTGRLLPDGHIGRMAVLRRARGQGVGGLLLAALMSGARQRGDREVLLSAQVHAEPFYQRHGFLPEGEHYLDAGIEHVTMRHVFGE